MKKIISTTIIIFVVAITVHYIYEIKYIQIGMVVAALSILGILAKFGHIRVLDDEGLSHYFSAIIIMITLTAVEGFFCNYIFCLPKLSGSMFAGMIATALCFISFIAGYSIWYFQIGKKNEHAFGKFLFG